MKTHKESYDQLMAMVHGEDQDASARLGPAKSASESDDCECDSDDHKGSEQLGDFEFDYIQQTNNLNNPILINNGIIVMERGNNRGKTTGKKVKKSEKSCWSQPDESPSEWSWLHADDKSKHGQEHPDVLEPQPTSSRKNKESCHIFSDEEWASMVQFLDEQYRTD
uniref:Uncharacterized protein n=1 Tax=Biomphalaria glabrata TaxID=6526 RepID=A0A2C9KJJ2_BIOGL